MASNPYVNKVQKADGSVIIDISDTTAVDSDVASGKYFYASNGQKKIGTGANDFIVTVSYNSTTQMWEPDCTFAEYQTARSAGKTITVQTDDAENASADGVFYGSPRMSYIVREFTSASYHGQTRSVTYEYWYDFTATGVDLADDYVYVYPSGTLSIAQNGTGIDVAAYASVDVAVPLPTDGNNMSFGYTDVTLPYVGIAKVGQAVI